MGRDMLLQQGSKVEPLVDPSTEWGLVTFIPVIFLLVTFIRVTFIPATVGLCKRGAGGKGEANHFGWQLFLERTPHVRGGGPLPLAIVRGLWSHMQERSTGRDM